MKYLFLSVIASFILSCSVSKNSKEVGPSNLQTKLNNGKAIFIENTTIKEDLNFAQLLPANMVRAGFMQGQTLSSITYKNCVFEGKVAAKMEDTKQTTSVVFMNNVTFLDCTFKQEVDFSECSIQGIVDFSGSLFKAKANFQNCTFFQKTYFNNCQFYKESFFQNAFFFQTANYTESEFFGHCSFQEASFMSPLIMNICKFSEYADFSLANFNTACFFNHAEFSKQAVFSNTSFAGRSEFLSCNFVDSDFEGAIFQRKPRMSKCKVSNSLKFQNATFMMGKPDLEFLDKDKKTW